MKDNKRLLIYLLINVVVSACTILAVLWIWDPANRPAALKPEGGGQSIQSPIVVPTGSSSTAIPILPTAVQEYPKGMIKIENIIGAGSAASEIVVLRREAIVSYN